ncbi:SDR family NAD(P)-dependent oxidoreductase [Aeromicrobium sp. Leaf350]|uniref:SDR family NAD(P)-dependent oxidoreductase n=1 Tax=Aeromicrobium sp. Leaf350 TaxID=2876565 RepID=UPI001E5EA06E|nr:SDR family NAD(P)-dependent oxidoreductase [Aeromicrobium sp. Leaf350]
MKLQDQSILVTGGASGLGLATVKGALEQNAHVIIADLAQSPGSSLADELGDRVTFVETDVTEPEQVNAAVQKANSIAPLRAVVHTAGRGGAVRLVDKEGRPGDSALFEAVVKTNLVGSFNVSAAAAAVMAENEPVESERGVIVLTASVAAFEGQIGQTAYAASKAGIVGMTLVAARDLARKGIRVNTIAPGLMDTPLLGRLRDDIRASLAASVPNPARLGDPQEFADLALHLVDNRYINGETIRIDGAIRMAVR